MSMLEEFKKFAFKGNVVDLAVGVIIGGAFGSIVKGLTDWIIMPILGLVTGGIDFSTHYLVLKAPKPGEYANVDEMITKGGAVVMRWGSFINSIITFVLVAWAVFLIVKAMNRAMAKKEEAPAPPPKSEVLLEEIRDLLAGKPKAEPEEEEPSEEEEAPKPVKKKKAAPKPA